MPMGAAVAKPPAAAAQLKIWSRFSGETIVAPLTRLNEHARHHDPWVALRSTHGYLQVAANAAAQSGGPYFLAMVLAHLDFSASEAAGKFGTWPSSGLA